MVCKECEKFISDTPPNRFWYRIVYNSFNSYIVLGEEMGYDKKREVIFCSWRCLIKWCSKNEKTMF